MKKQFYLYLLILSFFGISCSESEDGELDGATGMDTAVIITISDQEGLDLLDPTNNFYFDESDIKIFHKVDGELTEFFAGLLDVPKGFRVFSPEEVGGIYGDYYLFSLGMTNRSYFTSKIEEFTTTYIQWDETDMDTVICQNIKISNDWISTKVWYNRNLMWDYYDSDYDRNLRKIHVFKTL